MISLIDIEASGLGPDSYPIEIAIFDGGDLSESFLLNPETAEGWDYWDPIAEECIHKISYQSLVEEGKDVFLSIIRLNKLLEGKILYSDAVSSDGFWVDRLFDQALDRPKTFEIRSIYSLFKPEFEDAVRDTKEALMGEIAHRALADCKAIHQALSLMPDPYWLNDKNLLSN